MDPVLTELLQLLELESVGADVFRGQSHDIGTPQVFGGQVLGQALAAAAATVTGERPAHSLHAYFLRRGDVREPIRYEVDRSRDGASFSNRRVEAIQRGRPIFNMTASFHVVEQGVEHQLEMPEVPGPEELPDKTEVSADVLAALPEKIQAFLTRKRPFMVRPLYRQDILSPKPLEPVKRVWIRANDRLPDDPLLHQVLFAYLSDYELLGTAIFPHGLSYLDKAVQMASLDHAVWFHRDFRVDEWLLFILDSPVTAGSRGCARGLVYTRDGRLVASTSQEGLIRLREPRN